MASRADGSKVFSTRRRLALAEARKTARISAMLATRPEDVSWLTGFSGEDSFVLFGPSWAVLLTDGRYGEQAQRECGDIDVHVRTGPMSEALAATLKGRRVRAIGVQAEHFTLAHQSAFAKALGGRSIKAIPHVPAGLRAVKDAGEIRAIRRSIRVAERAFKEMFSQGKRGFVGRCEREVAAELDYRMRLAGASAPAFETIVAAGPHASRPHYRPGGRRIAPDEAVLIDWGAMTDGYCSDLTRVVFTGRIPPKIAEIYEVVLRAQVAGIAAVRAGRACGAVDAAARDVIGRAGWGDNFTHGLGHGIGREIHELPGLVSRMKTRLRAGMVVTVEPGIYLPGVGGVRIEDDVLVSVDGPVRLGSLPTAARAMVLR